MAITETFKGRQKSKVPGQGDTAVRVFQVSGIFFHLDDVADAVPIDINDQYDNDNQFLLCNSKIPRSIGPTFFEVICSYAVPATGHYELTDDPLNLPWRYEWQPVSEDVPFDRDVDNNPVLNSAYVPPSSPPRKKILYWRLSIFSSESFFDFTTYRNFNCTVNSDSIDMNQPNGQSTTFSPGTIFCNYVRPTRAYSVDDKVIPMERMFDIYDLSQLNITDPFQLHMLDQGSSGWYTFPGGNQVVPGRIVYEDNSPVSGDVALDGHGKPVRPTGGGSWLISPPTPGGSPQIPVAAPNGTPKGAVIENSGNTDFPAIFLKYKRYKSIPMLPLLSQS